MEFQVTKKISVKYLTIIFIRCIIRIRLKYDIKIFIFLRQPLFVHTYIALSLCKSYSQIIYCRQIKHISLNYSESEDCPINTRLIQMIPNYNIFHLPFDFHETSIDLLDIVYSVGFLEGHRMARQWDQKYYAFHALRRNQTGMSPKAVQQHLGHL